jgi:hypothetical protein
MKRRGGHRNAKMFASWGFTNAKSRTNSGIRDSRELDRQFNTCLFERAVLNPPKVAAVLRQFHPGASIGVLCATKVDEVVEYALSHALHKEFKSGARKS